MEDNDIDRIHKQIRTQTPQTDVYYGVLLATHTSRIHIVSVPVDVGVHRAVKPQDMEIERWLNLGSYGTQNVIDLATNFELLPAIVPEEPGEGAIFTLVMESQGPSFVREHRTRNHLLKNLFPWIPIPWAGNLLILKWSKQKGMMDIRHHEIPSIRKSIESFFHQRQKENEF